MLGFTLIHFWSHWRLLLFGWKTKCGITRDVLFRAGQWGDSSCAQVLGSMENGQLSAAGQVEVMGESLAATHHTDPDTEEQGAAKLINWGILCLLAQRPNTKKIQFQNEHQPISIKQMRKHFFKIQLSANSKLIKYYYQLLVFTNLRGYKRQEVLIPLWKVRYL